MSARRRSAPNVCAAALCTHCLHDGGAQCLRGGALCPLSASTRSASSVCVVALCASTVIPAALCAQYLCDGALRAVSAWRRLASAVCVATALCTQGLLKALCAQCLRGGALSPPKTGTIIFHPTSSIPPATYARTSTPLQTCTRTPRHPYTSTHPPHPTLTHIRAHTQMQANAKKRREELPRGKQTLATRTAPRNKKDKQQGVRA